MATYLRPHLAATLATASLLAAACGADDAGRPEGLRDIRDTTPVAGAVTDATQDAPDDIDEPIPGVFVPAAAFQIDDDLDLAADRQLEYLHVALDAFLSTTSALNSGVWDEAELARHYAGSELQRSVDAFRYYEERGLLQVNDGTTVEFLRIGSVTDDTVVIHRCIANGPGDGVIDLATGEYLFEADESHRLTAVELRRAPVAAGAEGPRLVGETDQPDVACP